MSTAGPANVSSHRNAPRAKRAHRSVAVANSVQVPPTKIASAGNSPRM